MNYSKLILAAVLIMGAPMSALGSAYKPSSEQLKQLKQIAHDAAKEGQVRSEMNTQASGIAKKYSNSESKLKIVDYVHAAMPSALIAGALWYYYLTLPAQEPVVLAPLVACWERAFRSGKNLGEAFDLLEQCR